MSSPIIVTLISAKGLSPADIGQVRQSLERHGGRVVDESPFDPPHATDLIVEGIASDKAREVAEQAATAFDVACQLAEGPRVKKLFLADMDSTMIGQECIDELADFAGLKKEISAITEAAMRGELDFPSALEERVRALKGLDEDVIATCLAERITPNPGAKTLVRTMRAKGARTALVSGGFTAFTGPIAGHIGFHDQHANVLGIRDGKLDGTVGHPIVDSARKHAILVEKRERDGLAANETLAVGDGANDIPMIREAGLGVAYHAKPAAQEAADAGIRFGDLTTLLSIQGIPRAEWTED